MRARAFSNWPVLLVAKHDMAKGTLLRDIDMEWRPFAIGTHIDGQIQRDQYTWLELRGSLLMKDVKAGEAILDSSIIRRGEQGFITNALKPGMRAMSINGNQLSAVSGHLSPGDLIDVVMTTNMPTRRNRYGISRQRVAETVFEGIKILAIDQATFPGLGSPFQFGAITIEVTPSQAQQITIARSLGRLTFLARRRDELNSGPAYMTDLDTSQSLIDGIVGNTVDSLHKRRRELGRDDTVGPIRTYGANVPKVIQE